MFNSEGKQTVWDVSGSLYSSPAKMLKANPDLFWFQDREAKWHYIAFAPDVGAYHEAEYYSKNPSRWNSVRINGWSYAVEVKELIIDED